jgi:hypothetical protein
LQVHRSGRCALSSKYPASDSSVLGASMDICHSACNI